MNSIYIYLIIFACIAYLIVTDESVAALVNYSSRLLRFHYEKVKWMVVHSPDNLIVRWLIHRRSMKIAKELLKELENKNK
jgi:hypothetical protein